MSHNQVQIQFITPKSINIHLQSVLVKLFYSLSTKYASCRILSCLFPLSSHVPISLFFCRLNYLPHPFQLFQILSILQDPNSLQQHKMHDLLPGPGFNNLCCTWVLIAHTIWSFHVYLALLWCISLLCWCFPVTLLLTFQIHYVFHAFIGCKFLRIDKLCLIIFGVITAPGSRPCTKKQLIKPLLLNFSAL